MDIREIAVKYIKSLQQSERDALKNMVLNGAICCHTYAQKHNLTPEMFTKELKAIFEE